MRKQQLADAGHRERIGEPGQHAEQHEQGECGT
jgi:hypothetical protein